MKVNYYEVLGVERSASEQAIRDQFRKLAREHHPDRYKGADKAEAERRFQTLTEAVNVLNGKVLGQVTMDGLVTPLAIDNEGGQWLFKRTTGNKDTLEFWSLGANGSEKVAEFSPADAKGFHYLALAANRIPALARQAVQAIESAVQREPVNALYLKDAGLICKRAGLVAKAERYLDEALKWDVDNIEVQSALAELRHGKGESKESGKGFTLFKKG